MLFCEQKTFSSFQKIVKMQWKVIKKYKNLMNQKTKHKNYYQNQEKKNMSSNWQCIRYQLYKFTIMTKFRNKKEKTETIINYKRHKTK